MSEALLVARGLGCMRGGRWLFERLDVAVPPGGALLVSGANGAGKSSLLRVLAGLLPGEGAIVRASRLALMAEQDALDRERRLADALLFWARLDAVADPIARVAAALESVALAGLADVPVRLLSTGQRRRAALARVVAAQVELWLLDEPASGLDLAAVTRLESLVAQHRARGGGIVVTTHQPIALPDAARIMLA